MYVVATVSLSSSDLLPDKERFMHFHGEIGARLDRDDSALAPSKVKSRSSNWIFNVISPFLFFMPFVYLKELQRTYVDQSVHYYFWRQFISGLKRDWENSITPVSCRYFRFEHALTYRYYRLLCCSPQASGFWPLTASIPILHTRAPRK